MRRKCVIHSYERGASKHCTFKLEEVTSASGSQKFHPMVGLEVDSFSLYDLEKLHEKSLQKIQS